MTPAAILALVRDVALLAGVGFVLWFVMHAEHNADELKNIKATLTQQAQWHKESTDAGTKAANSLTALDNHLNDIDKRGPVIVRIPMPAPVGAPTAATSPRSDACPSPSTPSAVLRPIDLRPVLESAERPLATAMIGCQELLDAWPK